ncbi:kinase phosphorylation protein-domain-containing protein [Lentinula edodes]|nr:kinase phosphorylation protein-domain-containing protein [Lentinula edodes]
MFEPIRGGTRGGQGDFKWTDVSADKDRENYLGHSINAPTGRWQKNKDVHWYSRDLKDSEAERLEEIRKIKEAEADALAVALYVALLSFVFVEFGFLFLDTSDIYILHNSLLIITLFSSLIPTQLLTLSPHLLLPHRGFTPEPRSSSKPDTGTGTMSSLPSSLPPSVSPGDGDKPTPRPEDPKDPQRVIEKEEARAKEKEEKRRRKEERRARKEERRVRKESRKESRSESKEEGRRWDRGGRGDRGDERGDRGDRGRRYEDHHQHYDEYNRRRHILPSDRRPSPSPTRLETRRRIERNKARARDSDSRSRSPSPRSSGRLLPPPSRLPPRNTSPKTGSRYPPPSRNLPPRSRSLSRTPPSRSRSRTRSPSPRRRSRSPHRSLATPPAAAPISPQNEDVVNRGRGLDPERRR